MKTPEEINIKITFDSTTVERSIQMSEPSSVAPPGFNQTLAAASSDKGSPEPPLKVGNLQQVGAELGPPLENFKQNEASLEPPNDSFQAVLAESITPPEGPLSTSQGIEQTEISPPEEITASVSVSAEDSPPKEAKPRRVARRKS